MQSLKEYFANHSNNRYPEFDALPCYKATIENFYEDFIRPHFEKLFVYNKSSFVKWCEILNDYANSGMPIFWIRQFESGSGKANVNDNRRTGTTVLVDKSKNAIAAFAYISNFDAQELYNIFLNVNPSDKNEFESLMMNGEYKFHYDNGKGSNESAITSFECLSHANSLGIFNRARLYLAHIEDVNGTYISNEYHFDKGHISDWKPMSAYPSCNFLNIFSKNCLKKVKVLEYADDVASLKKYLKAHFLRFVHPFNYYLVPGQNYEINAIFGKTKKSIGEYRDLTDYVRYRMYIDFIIKDEDLLRHYKIFEDAISIDDARKITRNFSNIEAECEKIKTSFLHVVYGSSVGKEGQLLEKLSKKIVNIDEMYDIYKNYAANDVFAIYEHKTGTKVSSYRPESISTFIDMLEKISNKIRSNHETVLVRLEKPMSTKALKSSTTSKTVVHKTSIGASGRSRRRYTEYERIQEAAYYLRYECGLEDVELQVLGVRSSGSTAQTHLQSLGIDTSRNSKHKGMLKNTDIQTAIDNATGTFKKTLEKIKELGL